VHDPADVVPFGNPSEAHLKFFTKAVFHNRSTPFPVVSAQACAG
jgi:hypothetical protein